MRRELERVDQIDEVRSAVTTARAEGRLTALVPTMGYLHDGHLSLVRRARESADWVGLSIFVNPLQFGPGEDFERYPRDLQRDLELAEAAGVDQVFTPTSLQMYPDGEPWTAVVAESATDRLCGASRPGHFRGVLTVVAKLFGIYTPDIAVFGQKDYQQYVLIRRMASDLNMPIEVLMAPIVREADGLALSSRNVYLSSLERSRALALPAALAQCERLFEDGERRAELYREALAQVAGEGVQLEYSEVVDPATLERVDVVRAGVVCAIAAHVGNTRLIDNLVLGTRDVRGVAL